MNTADTSQLFMGHGNAVIAVAIVLVGFAAGLILGRALARMIKSPGLAGFACRMCIIVGTFSALPMAYHFATKVG